MDQEHKIRPGIDPSRYKIIADDLKETNQKKMLKECCKSQCLNVNYSEIKKELLMDS
jgi:hypothetical protein